MSRSGEISRKQYASISFCHPLILRNVSKSERAVDSRFLRDENYADPSAGLVASRM